MNHIKEFKIFESDNILYKEVERASAMDIIYKDAINITNDSIKKICKLLDNEFYYIDYTYIESNMIKDVVNNIVIKYCKFHFEKLGLRISITEAEDDYYGIFVDNNNNFKIFDYYICDTIQGVLQLLQSLIKEKVNKITQFKKLI